MRLAALVCVLLSSAAASPPALAQPAPGQRSLPSGPTSKTAPIPPARDVPYPGTIQLTVDASDVMRGIFKIHERVPVSGPLEGITLGGYDLVFTGEPVRLLVKSGDLFRTADLRLARRAEISAAGEDRKRPGHARRLLAPRR